MRKPLLFTLLCALACLAPAWAANWNTLPDNIYIPRASLLASDSAKVQLQDTTLALSGKRIIVGSLHDPAFNCVNATPTGATFDCGGSFEKFRELEKSTSYHNTARGDSGNVFPAEFSQQITTGSDSLVFLDRTRGTMFAAVVKGANNACGNSNFNDTWNVDGHAYVATSGGLCDIDIIGDKITFYSTSGIGIYSGTFQQRNAARGTLTINASPAIVSNTVNSVSAIRDPGGLRERGTGRLAQWWGVSTAARISWYNPYTNSIYDETGSAITSNRNIFLPGGTFARLLTDVTQYYLGYKYSALSIVADGASLFDELWYNGGSGSEDWAWGNAVIPNSLAAIPRASRAGTEAPQIIVGSDATAYFLHVKANDNTNGVKVRVTNEGIYPPEHGDCVLAWSGWESSDGSPYNNALTGVGGPGYNTTGSSTVVFSGAYSSTSNSYLNRIGDSDFNLGNDAPFTISLYFKSQSATNPSAQEELLDMSDATDNDQVHIFFATDGTITARVTDDARVSYDSVDPSADYYDGNWHHLELVFDATSFIVRMDGETSATTTQSNVNTSVDPNEVWIGAGYAANNFFNGMITQATICKEEDTLAFSRWLYARMVASLNIEGNGRKSPSVDIDYVQTHGDMAVLGDEDSLVVWDAVLDLPLPKRRYGSPGGNIQDCALYAYGADSLGVYLVTTTRTQLIQPDVRAIDLAQYQHPFVQPAIGERVVVDSTGIICCMWTGNDATNVAFLMGRRKVDILKGTYPGFTADQYGLFYSGESDSSTIIDGANASIGITVTQDFNYFHNIGVKTTVGGSGGFDAISVANTATDNTFDHVRVLGADDDCVNIDGPRTKVVNSDLRSCDDEGIDLQDESDHSIVAHTIIKDQGGDPIVVFANGESSIITNNQLEKYIIDGETSTTKANNSEVSSW